MPLRLIEAVIPRSRRDEMQALAEDHPVIDFWREEVEADLLRLGLLVDAGAAEPVMDELERRFGDHEAFRLVLLPVQASLPRPEEPEEEETEQAEEERRSRISREELHADLSDSARLDAVYLVLISLSAVVCSFALLTGSETVVIGAMVIAPLLGPLVAVSLATTLADRDLALESLRASAAGIGVAFLLAFLLGAVLPMDPSLPGIASRSTAGLTDVALALASGSAGALAFTTAVPSAVVGVMVAVALVPPVVAAGLLFGGGHPGDGAGALLLTFVNLICVNLAGVVTFLLQGVRPNRWWEAQRAKRATLVAVTIWSLLLLALIAAILWTPAGSGVWGGSANALP